MGFLHCDQFRSRNYLHLLQKLLFALRRVARPCPPCCYFKIPAGAKHCRQMGKAATLESSEVFARNISPCPHLKPTMASGQKDAGLQGIEQRTSETTWILIYIEKKYCEDMLMGKHFSPYNYKVRRLIFPFLEHGYFFPNNGPNHTKQLSSGQHHGVLLTTSKRPSSSCTPGNNLGKPSPGCPGTCCHLLLPCPLQGSSSFVVRGRFAGS